MIKKFKITGLFGFRNVDINFENNVKILIGENGFGKTTVLNSLYYLLNKKYTYENQPALHREDLQDYLQIFLDNDIHAFF